MTGIAYPTSSLPSATPSAALRAATFNGSPSTLDLYSQVGATHITTAHDAAIGGYMGPAASPQPGSATFAASSIALQSVSSITFRS